MYFALEKGKGWEFAEALGSARFSSPRIDVEKLDNIVVVAERVGLDGAEREAGAALPSLGTGAAVAGEATAHGAAAAWCYDQTILFQCRP